MVQMENRLGDCFAKSTLAVYNVNTKRRGIMSETPNQGKSSDSSRALPNVIKEIQLAWQLFHDERVPSYAKILPAALVGIYIIFPLDLIPDLFLGLGQIDDLAVFLLGLALFRALVPDHLIKEYTTGKKDVRQEANKATSGTEDYVDAEYSVLRDDE